MTVVFQALGFMVGALIVLWVFGFENLGIKMERKEEERKV